MNEIDIKGLTPLHLAVKQYEENQSSKSVKMLLCKGADRFAKDFQNKMPIDCLEGKTDELAAEIRRILN